MHHHLHSLHLFGCIACNPLTLVEESFYPSTWILKPLLKAPKPPLSKGTSLTSTTLTSTTLTSTTLTSTTLAGVIASSITNNSINKTNISTSPYKLNKLNARKSSFIKDKEIIIGYKFKYFRKGNKKG
jgi:hypothetical protein